MLTALVLVCSLTTTPDLRECNRDNAVHVFQVPEEFALPSMCAIRGQADEQRERQGDVHPPPARRSAGRMTAKPWYVPVKPMWAADQPR